MPTATVSTARPGVDFQVGTSIPPATAHAVSVSLPRWQDNVDYEEGRLKDVMQTGYPRFFIHRSIQALSSILLARFGQRGTTDANGEDCILVPSKRVADSCRAFMQAQHAKQTDNEARLPVRSVQVCLNFPSTTPSANNNGEEGGPSWSSPGLTESAALDDCSSPNAKLSVHVVLFPKASFPLAKQFWQHTGDGICSRMAETYLDLLEQSGKLHNGVSTPTASSALPSPSSSQILNSDTLSTNGDSQVDPAKAFMKNRSYSRNRHYSRNGSITGLSAPSPGAAITAPSTAAVSNDTVESLCADHATYLEERYGRNMARIEAPRAKRALRKRIAGMASNDVLQDGQEALGNNEAVNGHADVVTRSQVDGLTEDDVYLYPTGMSAIFHAHQLSLRLKDAKSVCFGFPYLDTLKILEKWGKGCFFLGHGDEGDLDRLRALLESGQEITSLFCEVPSNPLLRTANLTELRRLATAYGFLLVVDESIGNFVNVEVLPYADIVVSSLTKLFSGEANGMGGSLVLNPKGNFYAQLRSLQDGGEYEDNYFDQNAIFLERNSRDFAQRSHRINLNAEKLVELLCDAQKGAYADVIKKVYYPTLIARENYEVCKRPNGGYGGLFSITFHSMRAAVAFYDALNCAKGPSLGTNFTLASPFVILAHYGELDWAAQYGVESHLVRVSVGLESFDMLQSAFETALQATTTSHENNLSS